jgi:hypothetical protein
MTTSGVYLSLPIRHFVNGGAFRASSAGRVSTETASLGFEFTSQPPTLRLHDRLSTDPEEMRSSRGIATSLAAVPQPFGGVRWWFDCPRCCRRCATLYLPRAESAFGCRRCYGLKYASQQTDCADRMHRRAAAVCRRLGLSREAAWGDRPPWLPTQTTENALANLPASRSSVERLQRAPRRMVAVRVRSTLQASVWPGAYLKVTARTGRVVIPRAPIEPVDHP